MDKLNFVSDGGNKLPPGFRFEPTDEEIVFQYLARKTFSYPLPALVIPEINVFSFDPWELPAGNSDHHQDKYFFSYVNDSQISSRATCSGYWKAIGSTKRIICSKKTPIVGIRKTLVFYQRKKNYRAFRTDWIMHEYCIVLSGNSASNYNIQHKNNSQGTLTRIGNWTLCRIFMKKRSSILEVDDHDNIDEPNMKCDYLSDTDSSSASSSSPNSDFGFLSEVSNSSIVNGEKSRHNHGFTKSLRKK